MITNERQYKTTVGVAARLRESINTIDESSFPDLHPLLVRAQRDGLASQLAELEEEIAEYEGLKSGAVTSFEAQGLRDLPLLLIKARIARGMSQKDLADFLGLKEQQIQRYEADGYRAASLERLIEIADALGVQIEKRAELQSAEPELDDFLAANAFPIAEMYKRGWFEDFDGSLAQARKQSNSLLHYFFSNAGRPTAALHRRSIRGRLKPHSAALAAWEARVISCAERAAPSVAFSSALITAEWISDVVRLSTDPCGLQRIKGALAEVGIAFVVERQLPGTSLDGAAVVTPSGTRAIAITLRYDRLDNFWFTLFHEVAHLKMHLGGQGLTSILDDNDVASTDPIEAEADRFAREALIPEERWRECLSRFTRTERAVRRDAEMLGVDVSIVAGRVRRELGDYTLFSNLVGAGRVSAQLEHKAE